MPGKTARTLMRFIGTFCLIVGFVVLVWMVNATSPVSGGPKGCGNGFATNDYAAKADAVDNSAYGWGRLFDLPRASQAVNPGGKSAIDQCDDKLARQRLIGYPLLVIGVGLHGAAFIVRERNGRATFGGEKDSQAQENGIDIAPIRADLVEQSTVGHALNRPVTTPPSPSSGQRFTTGLVHPAPPAGWYPDQMDHGRVRWFDGSQWTDATLPRSGPPQS